MRLESEKGAELSIVEFAAYVIIGEAAGRLISSSITIKRRRIESAAVKAECEELENAKFSIPDDEPEWTRQRKLKRYHDRQQELLMRYPEVLVRAPDYKHLREATLEDKESHPPFLKSLKKYWIYYAAAAAGILIHFLVTPFLAVLWDRF